jgi:hypothetical protein
MTLLTKFLQLLELIEATQALLSKLNHPTELLALVGVGLYGVMLIVGWDSLSATTFTCLTLMVLYWMMEPWER